MKVNFLYNENKDAECLISKGGGSINSPGKKTKTFEALLSYTSEVTNLDKVTDFVRDYIKKNKLDLLTNAQTIKKAWDEISDEFEKRAEKVFGIKLDDVINAYLTIAGRYPYNIEEKYFYVSGKSSNVNAVVMHELWHFYTYYKFADQIKQIGEEKYNNIKESLTVLLNIECADLLAGKKDEGYPQHQDLRNQIAEIWSSTKDIEKVWEAVTL